jgi:endonuclease/exonuclease/phosphatase family metal-dependent hydrolase
MPVEERSPVSSAEAIHRLIREEVRPHLRTLSLCRNSAELSGNATYQRLRPAIQRVLETPELGCFGPAFPPAKPRYRFVAWNLERGCQLDAQIEALRTHPYLHGCDVLLLTETDVGMARSGNRAVALEMARELGFHYAFIPCYISLVKGSGVENWVPGENELGLHGDAILSRYPLSRVRPIQLPNGTDKFGMREKRFGCSTVVAADIDLPGCPVTVAAVHLDAHSSQTHRRDQMRTILDRLGTDRPVILGGDWNTSTYNSSHAFHAIMGFWLRVLMGVDSVIRNHYLHPDRLFERDLFRLLEERGFDYRYCNVPGERTISYDIRDLRARHSLGEWVPAWCFPFIHWSLREHDGRCPFKLDWFATRGVTVAHPVVLHEFREGRDTPLSDHDPIGMDVVAEPGF